MTGSSSLDSLSPILNAPADRPFVVAQLGQSLDGRIATPTGASRWINRGSALDHVHRLRASVDAVVVGIGTVVADDPLLTVRRVKGAHPARVVIDPSGRMKPTAHVLRDDGVRRLVIRTCDGPVPNGVETVTLARNGLARITPSVIVAALFKLGLKRLLIEGGATTVSAFVNDKAVDRLHVLVAPMILGSGKMGLCLDPIAGLDEASRPLTRVYPLDDGDVLFDCDLRTSAEGGN